MSTNPDVVRHLFKMRRHNSTRTADSHYDGETRPTAPVGLDDLCPHSTAPGARKSQCSQCQAAPARVVRVDAGHLWVDGQSWGTYADALKARQSDEEQANVPMSRRICFRCQHSGHLAYQCVDVRGLTKLADAGDPAHDPLVNTELHDD